MKGYKGLLLVMVLIIMLLAPTTSSANTGDEQILELIEGIIEWKKESEGIATDRPLLSKSFLEHAGDTVGDWYPIGLGRIGYTDDYAAYLAVVENNVMERYQEEHKLSEMKATEWHRIALAILATGGDPTNVGGIHLIADGTYDRAKTISIGAQGLNGWIWGLITLDSMRYKVPEDAATTRKEMITEILSFQLENGGFSFYQDEADTDMTAMAIQALAPYYNGDETFTYVQKDLEKTVTKTVAQSIDEALQKLSSMQNDNGGFQSWDEENAESVAQVIVALTSLGIDPNRDERFIKGGHTLLENLLTFQQQDGGFIHSKMYNPDNPSSLPDESNSMASEQVLYALVSLYRLQNDYRTLYDFRSEQSTELKKRIQQLRADIERINESTTKVELMKLVHQYESIPIEERSYVFNFHKLTKQLEKHQITYESDSFTEAYNLTTEGNGAVTPIYGVTITSDVITEEQLQKVDEIGKQLSTQYTVDVVTLIRHFEQAKNRHNYEQYLTKLYDFKEQIEAIEKEVAAINERVLNDLYPFNELSIADRENVEEIVARINALSPYDQTKVLNYEDVKKSTTQIQNLIRERYISVGLSILAVIAVTVVVIRIKRRRKDN